jgi:hypothetical protein
MAKTWITIPMETLWAFAHKEDKTWIMPSFPTRRWGQIYTQISTTDVKAIDDVILLLKAKGKVVRKRICREATDKHKRKFYKIEEMLVEKPHNERFNLEANTVIEAKKYMLARAKQVLRLGYLMKELNEYEWGVEKISEKDGILYQSIYLLKDFRGKGLYKSLVKHTILTSDECDLVDYLNSKRIDHVCVSLNPYMEYQKISEFYRGNVTSRSGIEFMNHIDEGLYILERLGASDIAKKAYCLHPIFQSDSSLEQNFNLKFISPLRNPLVIVAAIEYRSVANEYLSTKKIENIEEIRLSPLKDVNDMLIADKIQNRKDFELYHLGKHERSDELDEYFKNWFKRLQITEEFYQEIKAKL